MMRAMNAWPMFTGMLFATGVVLALSRHTLRIHDFQAGSAGGFFNHQ
jgi:hypothetical protein